MTAVARLRLAIKKDNALQFLSHLDFARAVRLIVIRADLPVLYSEGFNPHMKLSFASALGVGVAADEEFMDLELAKEIPVDDVMARMNEKSPLGFAVLCGKKYDKILRQKHAISLGEERARSLPPVRVEEKTEGNYNGKGLSVLRTRPRDGEDYGRRPGTVITVL